MSSKIKDLLSAENKSKVLNLIYSIGAAAIFNMVIQLLVYPYFERRLGSDRYGVALSVLSLIAITAGTCGYAVNCSRLLGVEKGRTDNGDYNLILLFMGILGSIIGISYLFYLQIATPLSILLYVALMFTTMLRYYAEVEFRISTNFFRYMVYYVLISVGYAAGLLLFRVSGQWMLTLILGETLAFLYVCFCGTIFRPPFFKRTKHLVPILSSIGFVFLSAFIDNITLHADRILLLAITGDGTAVTTYYIASLVGKIISMLTLPINAIIISYLVRYRGGLTAKIWTVIVGAAGIFGAIGFGGCMLVSPILIRILYPDNVGEAMQYLMPAILGQIFYFVSGVLMMVLLRFKGEKKQFFFNGAYAVEFFACVAVGTVLGGLSGFVWSILIANALRFVAAVAWGFLGKKKDEIPATAEESSGNE